MQPKSKKQIDELVQVGGGATGVSMVPDPIVGGSANRPQDKNQGEKALPKSQNPAGTGEEETDPENNTAPTGDLAAQNAASIAAKAAAVKEHIDAMFSGEELSEEFIQKATTIFEAAVDLRVQEEVAEIRESYEALVEEAVQEVYEEIVSKTDDYLTYVVEQWVEDNSVAIESALKIEVMEDFMSGLKNLFIENYIDIPEDKVDVVETLASSIQELETKLNTQISENIQLKKSISGYKKQDIFNDVSEGLALTQVEKFSSLCEGVAFEDEDSFKKKLAVIKESYFPNNTPKVLTEEENAIGNNEELDEGVKVIDPNMRSYFNAISRTNKT